MCCEALCFTSLSFPVRVQELANVLWGILQLRRCLGVDSEMRDGGADGDCSSDWDAAPRERRESGGIGGGAALRGSGAGRGRGQAEAVQPSPSSSLLPLINAARWRAADMAPPGLAQV